MESAITRSNPGPDTTGPALAVPVYRCRLEQVGSRDGMRTIAGPEAAVAVAREIIPADADRIHVAGIALDIRGCAIGAYTIGIGTIDHALVSPADCLKPALLLNAYGIVVAMNHVSGGTGLPSRETRGSARRLDSACAVLGVPLFDFLILGETAHTSLREMGYLQKLEYPAG